MSDQGFRDRAIASFHYPAIQRAASPELVGFGTSDAYRARDLAVQQELAAAVEAARKKGFQEGQAAASAAAVQMIEQERSAVTAAVHDFGQQRTEYFRHVETETVQLALSIARKVLHREAQMDPLLLAGVVRVALDQMQAGTRLALRTSPSTARVWAEFCSQHLQKDHTIEVIPDSTLEGHRCILQAEVGSTEISLDAQLHEIESGFFDLLQAKTEDPR